MSKQLLFAGAALALALSGADAFSPAAVPALRNAGAGASACPARGDYVTCRLGNLFGGGDKKDGKEDKKDDLEDAIDDWKEIGFDIEEVLKAEEEAKKKQGGDK